MQYKDIYLVLWILFLIGLIISIVFIFYEHEDSIYPEISTGVCGFFFIMFLIIYIVFDQEKYNQIVKENAEQDRLAKKWNSDYNGKAPNIDLNSASLLYPARRFVSMSMYDKLKWWNKTFGNTDDYVDSLERAYRRSNDPNQKERFSQELDNYLEKIVDERPDTAPIFSEGEQFANPLSPENDPRGELRRRMLRPNLAEDDRNKIFQNEFVNLNRDKIVNLRSKEKLIQFPGGNGAKNPIDYVKEARRNETLSNGPLSLRPNYEIDTMPDVNVAPIRGLNGDPYFNPNTSKTYRTFLKNLNPEQQKEDFYRQFWKNNEEEIKDRWNPDAKELLKNGKKIENYQDFRNSGLGLVNKKGTEDVNLNNPDETPVSLLGPPEGDLVPSSNAIIN